MVKAYLLESQTENARIQTTFQNSVSVSLEYFNLQQNVFVFKKKRAHVFERISGQSMLEILEPEQVTEMF